MSYDLYRVSHPAEPSLSDPAITDDASDTFTINHAGMHALRTTMDALGMLAEGDSPEPPSPADFGLELPIPHPGEVETDDPALLAYWDANWEWLATGVEGPGIPHFKLTSNDGWHVTGEEVRAALAGIDEQSQPEGALWQRWMAFLRGAARADGFVVW